MIRCMLASCFFLLLVVSVACHGGGSRSHADTAVTTYHYDPLRTGWNAKESTLTPGNVQVTTNCATQKCFGLLYPPTTLDEQVDAQPLVVPHRMIKHCGLASGECPPGDYDVVYVATENNSIYAINSDTGTVLFNQLHLGASTLGPAVPIANLPPGPYSGGGPCNNNSNNVGINSTPVIDLDTQTLYAITYNLTSGVQTYYLHALDLGDLSEKSHSPQPISATSGPYSFSAPVQRQRAALLQANGNIYAGFASFCDYQQNFSRGWLLGWHGWSEHDPRSLQLLGESELTNRTAASSSQPLTGFCSVPSLPCYLSTIWMSGYGLAADKEGNIYFATGNSAGNYSSPNNVEESAVKISPDLSTIGGIFTPYNPQGLDGGDVDFGSSGVLLLPDQPGSAPHLAVAGGKDGNLYLLSRDNLGGLSTNSTPSSIIGGSTVPAQQIAPDYLSCENSHAGPSYFTGSDGVGRVVSSGGYQAMVWKIATSGSSAPALQLDTSSSFLYPTGTNLCNYVQDPGFFTSVSSDKTRIGTAIIWAVQRATPTTACMSQNNTCSVTLYAFDPTKNGTSSAPTSMLVNQTAGYWPNLNGNANIVPVVANGKVYVASYEQLAIFGLGASGTVPLTAPAPPPPQPNARTIFGKVMKVEGALVSMQLRSGKTERVDLAIATHRHRSVPITVGKSIGVFGLFDEKSGLIRAHRALGVEGSPQSWPEDR